MSEKKLISESSRLTKNRIWLVLSSGVTLVFFSMAIPKILFNEYNFSLFFMSLGLTFIATSLIALLLRMPTLLNDVNNSSIRLLKDNEFLKRLDIEELNKLRTDATECAYLKYANSPNSSLKKIDAKIAGLFLTPYFCSYKIIIKCKYREDGLLEKSISTTFKLNNPKKEFCNALLFLKTRVTHEKIDGIEIKELREIHKFQVIIDNEGDWKDLWKDYKLDPEEYEEESLPYDIMTKIKPKNDKQELNFDNNIQIKITETRVLKKEDNRYTHRVSSPVENFSINYSFDDSSVNLIGTCFGTFQDTKNGGINIVKDSNSIDISTNSWLLNGNGIMIVHNINI